jgi:hypothetical protein
MALSNAATKQFDATFSGASTFRPGTDAYGGLVGQMINEIDARLAHSRPLTEITESPEDVFHTISVLCGYVGLAAGFSVAAATIYLFL